MNIPSEIDGRFVVGEKLVERPNCHVHKGQDKQLGDREIALKLFVDGPDGDEDLISNFEQEVEKLRNVSHPVLVPIIAGGCSDDCFYLAMELLETSSLRDRLKDNPGPWEVKTALDLMRKIAEGLSEIHEHGSVHGHLDTRSILFKGNEVRLAGFYPSTIGKILKDKTSGGRLVVDPAYISPEQVSGSSELDNRADIYSLAVILFELLTGKRPFSSSNPLQAAMMRITDPVPSPAKLNGDIPPLVDAAIMKALAKDPNERFQTVDEFIDALEGGKAVGKDEAEEAAIGTEGRMSTETIAVSMSREQLQGMLDSHEASRAAHPGGGSAPSASEPSETAADQTMVGAMPAINGSGGSHDKDQLDVASTMVGMQAGGGVLKGSFVLMSGPQAGKRYHFEGDQTMVGSDTFCEVCVSGKDVPSRYAIIVKRGEAYYIGALSAKPLIINGEEVEGTSEVELTRGDVVSVGDVKLRYVAPGEVFTFNEELVDRVIDRPKSRASLYIGIAAAVLIGLVVVAGQSYYSAIQQKNAVASKAAKKKAAAREAKIKELLREGDEFFRTGALVEPPENNARERFRTILELDPDHNYAKRRLVEIQDRLALLDKQQRGRAQVAQKISQLMADADRYFQSGNYVYPPGRNARDAYREILRIDPSNERAAAQLKEIGNILGDVVEQAEILLAKAQVYFDLGQYVKPKGQNAYEALQDVLKIDGDNAPAREALMDLAVVTVFEIDQAMNNWKISEALDSYDTALSLNVNPEFLRPRQERLKLMSASRKGTVIPPPVEDRNDYRESDKNGGYLPTSILQRRLAKLRLKSKRSTWQDRRIVIGDL